VTLAELLLGAFKSSQPNELTRTLGLVTGMILLYGDARTAIIYARIRQELERRGTVIPQNDIWIAAASIQADVPLITRDSHFAQIHELKVISY
jgi:tRNA(fMet)-specific endonuclease VapC